MTAGPDLEVARRILGPLAQADVSLAGYCTYRVGGPAALWVEAQSVEDLELVRQAVVESGSPTLVVGKGSNLLVSDRGFQGIVVHLGDGFAEITVDVAAATVRAGGSAFLPVVARQSAAAGLTGFEWAVGVPGSVGGAVRMNAGGHGSDMAATLQRAGLFDLVDGGPNEVSVEALELGYRRSTVGPSHVVVSAELQLDHGNRAESEAEISEIVRWRRANQPGGQNAGSVFANPPGDSAGRLIDSLGLKGLRIGTAEVSPKHANFIQADPGGSADDVHRLIVEVRRRVREATGLDLHPENRLIGFDPIDYTGADGAAATAGTPDRSGSADS
ncbi:MAG: UDP-N-acetylmuramate dehydrogenase [Acidimicrobiia bacterium]|nr:UDP-N-acetylmuramate dehydrogenase [Acidimicrobiia bacterium]